MVMHVRGWTTVKMLRKTADGLIVPAMSCSKAMPTFRVSAGVNLGSLPGESVLTSVGTDFLVNDSSAAAAATAAAAACRE